MIITSTSNAIIKELMKLKQTKYRNVAHCYLVEGEHLVEEAIKAGQVELIVSTKESTYPNTLQVSKEVMDKLAFTKTPQSIMAKCKMQLENEIIAGDRYLLLDDLQDPGNIGTLIRTALALEIHQVILSPHCVDIYNDKVLRSMQGANFHISCIYQELEKSIQQLKQQGVFVVGSALENGVDITSINKTKKMAIIVGNEGNGMNSQILSMCDAVGYIPITTIESLNVAIAGSIMMYHFQ